MHITKHPDLLFIDRLNYTQLLNKAYTHDHLQKIFQTLKGYETQEDLDFVRKAISPLTFHTLWTLNNVLCKALELSNACTQCTSMSVTETEYTYIQHQVKTFLENCSEEDTPVQDSTHGISEPKREKYCEIIPLVGSCNQDVLIVVEEGFFSKITKSKEALLEFFLTLLSYQYTSEAPLSPLLKRYLSLKVNEGQLDLVKLRFETPLH